MPNLLLSEIYIYPVKSLAGFRLTEAKIEKRGLELDRRWMLVDNNGTFLTQRQLPELALFDVALAEKGLLISHRQNPANTLLVPYQYTGEKSMLVSVWDDISFAYLVGKEADNWFSRILNKAVKLVYMPDNAMRHTDATFDPNQNLVSFADGYPFLLIGQSSLDDLNGKLKNPVPMSRFRPNFVFTGGQPFEEDTWHRFKIGDTVFISTKPCARCVITTINQETAEKTDEPLRTLAIYRQEGNKIYFGQNLVSETFGSTVEVGDKLEVLEMKPTP